MAGEALELALALHRAPIQRFALRGRPLPADIGSVIQLASGNPTLLREAAQRLCEPEPMVLEAVRFYLQQVLFDADADAYRTLGLAPGASTERIREHYRWLQRWLHPDRLGEEWEALYAVRVNWAGNLLRSEAARRAYDLEREPIAADDSVGTSLIPQLTAGEWRAMPTGRPPINWRNRIVLGVSLGSCALLLFLALTRDDVAPGEWPVNARPGSTSAGVPVAEALSADSHPRHSPPVPTPDADIASLVARMQAPSAGIRKPALATQPAPPVAVPAPPRAESPPPDPRDDAPSVARMEAPRAGIREPALATQPASMPAVPPPPHAESPPPSAPDPHDRAPLVARMQAPRAGIREPALASQPASMPAVPPPPHTESPPPSAPDPHDRAPLVARMQAPRAGIREPALASQPASMPAVPPPPHTESPPPSAPDPHDRAPLVARMQAPRAEIREPALAAHPAAASPPVPSPRRPIAESAAAAPPDFVAPHPDAAIAPAPDMVVRVDMARQRIGDIVAYFRRADAAAPNWQDASAQLTAQRQREGLRDRNGFQNAGRFALDPPAWRLSDDVAALDATYHVRGEGSVSESGRFSVDMVWRGRAWQITRIDLQPSR